MLVIASALALVGIAMVAVERLPHMSKAKDENGLSKPRALLIGVAQCFAIIPGISRAGSALFVGRIAGMDSKTSFRYANLVGIPVLAAIAVKSAVSSASRYVLVNNFQTIAFANAIAFVAGIIILHFLTKYFNKKNSLKPFGVYRIVIALIILVFELIR
jgi:undecaprenyl-diphosphatase